MTPSSEKARSKSSGESPPRGSDIDNDLGRALSATTHSLARRVRASYRGRSRNRRPGRDAARATARPRSDARRARPLTSSLASRVTATRERRHGRGGAARLRAARARDRRRRGVDSGAHPSPLDDAFHPPSPTRPLPTLPTPPRPATVRHDSRDTAARPLAHLPPSRVHQVGGDYAFLLNTLHDDFIPSAKAQLARCLVAAERCPDDPEATRALAFDAHSMKGAAAALRAGDLVRVCERLERIAKRLPDQHESDATPRALVADVAAKIRALAADAAELRRVSTFPVAHAATRHGEALATKLGALVLVAARAFRLSVEVRAEMETVRLRGDDARVGSARRVSETRRRLFSETRARRRSLDDGARNDFLATFAAARALRDTERDAEATGARELALARASCGARFATPPRRVGASTL